LTEAAGMVASMEFDKESMQVAKRISETIRLIGKTLKDKRDDEQDEF
jgi:hypothetical protein